MNGHTDADRADKYQDTTYMWKSKNDSNGAKEK